MAASVDYVRYTKPRWLFFDSTYVEQAAELQATAPSIELSIGVDDLDALIRLRDGTEVPDWSDPFAAPDAVMPLMPTGGTTTASKSVPIMNRQWAAMTEYALAAWPTSPHGVGDR